MLHMVKAATTTESEPEIECKDRIVPDGFHSPPSKIQGKCLM